ncbi:hypothetical protein GpartN1_g3474.t1 [Galdieria partita]|uniref:Uncharacterized protein n=1 Tax=Galdieria partita TaxID=83374 RepID=A0A9C7PVN0_9RHOD|nr:hypothetical protein GpartN1_g3474.t1 [Galdieria partita]
MDSLNTAKLSSFYKTPQLAFFSASSQAALLVSSGYRLRALRCSRSQSFSKCYLCMSKQSLGSDLTVRQKDVQLLGIVPLIPNWILIALYGYLGFRFFSGFEQTTYNKNSRLLLSILWPVMFIANDRFRQNFKKALKQSDNEDG